MMVSFAARLIVTRTWRSSCRSRCRSDGRMCGCRWSPTGTACWPEEMRTTCLSYQAPAARQVQSGARRVDRRCTRSALKVRRQPHKHDVCPFCSLSQIWSLHSISEESSVEGSWMMRNDTLQTSGALQTPQLTSTVLRENRAAEHLPDPDSEPGSENDYVHKWVWKHTHTHSLWMEEKCSSREDFLCVDSSQMQMSWLGQQKMEEVTRKDRTGMNYIKSRSNQGVRQTV